MRILFVCTGNICRSPMGEYLFRRYTQGTSLEIDSAGTHSLVGHAIDPSSKALLDAAGIDASEFRSTQLTQGIADDADLILCFEPEQQHNIVVIAPTALPYTFTLTDFSNMCAYCAQKGMISGNTIQERLQSVIDQSMLARPALPPAATIPDPYRKNFEAFRSAANATNDTIRNILRSVSYNATPSMQDTDSTESDANPSSPQGDMVNDNWPLPDLSFDGALPPADIIVKDDSEVETANTVLITPGTTSEASSDEHIGTDDMPVIVEDTSIHDKAVAEERKTKKRKTIIVASTLTVAALLAVGGGVSWHVASVNAKRDALTSCTKSANRYAKVKKQYDAIIQNANLLVSVPDDQLTDSSTVSTLKDALSNTYDFIPTTQCSASLSTNNLTQATNQNRKNASAMEKSLSTLSEAAKAVTKSRDAKAGSSIDDAKKALQTVLEQAKSLMDSSKGNVADKKTRTALQRAIDAANQLLNADDPDINTLLKARENLESAMKAVTDSVAKHNADTKAYETPSDSNSNNGGNRINYNPSIYAPVQKQNALNPVTPNNGNNGSNGENNGNGGSTEKPSTPSKPSNPNPPTPDPEPTPTPTPDPDPTPTPTPDPDPTPTPTPDPDPTPTPTPDPGTGGDSGSSDSSQNAE